MSISTQKNTLAIALQHAGSALADADIAAAFNEAELARQHFGVSAIVAGLMLLAKKETIPHGKWQRYVEKTLLQKRSTAALLPETFRTVQLYTNLAKRLLLQLENRTWEKPQVRSHYTPEQQEALAAVAPAELIDAPLSCREAIERIVAGRSIRRLLEDFREAQQMAAAEDNPATPAAPPEDPAKFVQQKLWDDWNNELEDVDQLLNSEHAHYLDPKQHWSAIATKLEEQAKRARALANAANHGGR